MFVETSRAPTLGWGEVGKLAEKRTRGMALPTQGGGRAFPVEALAESGLGDHRRGS